MSAERQDRNQEQAQDRDQDRAATPDHRAWLVLGGIHLLNGTRPLADGDAVVLVPVAPVETAFPSNTVVLEWASLPSVELLARSYDGTRRAVGSADGDRLFPGMSAGPELAAAVTAVDPDAAVASLVPLLYLSGTRSGDGYDLHVHSQVRFLAEDACFIRITDRPFRSAAPEELEWLPEALRIHAANALFLNNHQCYYRKLFEGRELEHKYTLAPPVDIWDLTVDVFRRLRSGGLPGYLMEYRDEFQAWDYVNHLFEVTAPEPDIGYISYIPTTDGNHTIKRKWFTEDAFDRRESHYRGTRVDTTPAEHLRGAFPDVTSRPLPPFRRVRYDVNFESVRTGHVYGIFFDHCTLLDAPHHVLSQCELEYLRSRTVVPGDEKEALAEMEEIAVWLEAFLDERGLGTARGHYSKLSFLRDAVSREPSLVTT